MSRKRLRKKKGGKQEARNETENVKKALLEVQKALKEEKKMQCKIQRMVKI